MQEQERYPDDGDNKRRFEFEDVVLRGRGETDKLGREEDGQWKGNHKILEIRMSAINREWKIGDGKKSNVQCKRRLVIHG